MLDMRGKKKKTTWEKWEAGDWLPRSTLCATRHGHQCGLTISNMCRRRQRKVYPTEQALKKAILSMLPKSYRNAEINIREWNIVYGETNSYLATVRIFEENIDSIGITKHSNGWSLRHGDDSIRSFTKELMVGIKSRLLELSIESELHHQTYIENENPAFQTLIQSWVDYIKYPNDATPYTGTPVCIDLGASEKVNGK